RPRGGAARGACCRGAAPPRNATLGREKEQPGAQTAVPFRDPTGRGPPVCPRVWIADNSRRCLMFRVVCLLLPALLALGGLPTPPPAGAPAPPLARLLAERKRANVKGEGFSRAEAERLANGQAGFVVRLDGGRSYTVLSKRISRAGD